MKIKTAISNSTLRGTLWLMGLTLVSQSAISAPSANSKKSLSHRAVDAIVATNPSAELQVFSGELFKGLDLSVGLNVEVGPAFHDGLYTRIDRYTVSPSLVKRHDFFPIDNDSDVEAKLGLNAAFEFAFIRQFSDSVSAVGTLPYFVSHVPWNAQRVVSKLQTGDIAVIKGKMGLVIPGLVLSESGITGVPIQLSASYLISGGFQIHVLKVNDQLARIKLVGLKSRGLQGEASVGTDLFEIFELVGSDWATERAQSALKLKPVKLSGERGARGLFMVDYVVNIRDLEIATAYDRVIRNAISFDFLKSLNPFESNTDLRQRLVIDITPLEKIYQRVKNDPEQNKILRNFKGSLRSRYQSGDVRLGIRLAKVRFSNSNTRDQIVLVDEAEKFQYYLLSSFTMHSERSALFSFFKMTKRTSIGNLYETDSNFENIEPESFVTNVVEEDKHMSSAEYSRVLNQVRRTLPPEIFEKIDFSKWRAPMHGKNKLNVEMRYVLVLNQSAISRLPVMRAEEIESRYLSFIQNLPEGSIDFKISDDLVNTRGGSSNLRKVSRSMAKYLDPELPMKQRDEALQRLKNSSFFRKTGLGFVLSLLPKEHLRESLAYSLDMSSTDKDRITFSYGDPKALQFYNKILYAQALLSEEGLDIRLESETINLERVQKPQ